MSVLESCLVSCPRKDVFERALYMLYLQKLSLLVSLHHCPREGRQRLAQPYKSFVRSSLSAIHFSSTSRFLTLIPILNGLGFSVKLVNI